MRFRAEGLPVIPTRVEVNQGYGHGILHAMPLATAKWIGIVPADGQVDAEDVVRLYESCRNSGRPVVGKVHRRFRLDGAVLGGRDGLRGVRRGNRRLPRQAPAGLEGMLNGRGC